MIILTVVLVALVDLSGAFISQATRQTHMTDHQVT